MTTRTVHDPFVGKDVQISDKLVDRLRGKYASGPHLPNGNPEFGWRQFQSPPIQHDAAARIEKLEAALRAMFDQYEGVFDMALPHPHQSDAAKRAEELARDALNN